MYCVPAFSFSSNIVVINRAPLNQLTLEDGLFAFIFLVLGIFSVLAGYKLYRVTFLLAGVYFGYILTYPILAHAGVTSPATLFGVSLAIGIVIGLVMVFVWKLGLFVIGCIAGYLFATFMIGFCHSTVLAQSPGCYIFTGICCLAMGIAALFFQRVRKLPFVLQQQQKS